MSGLTFHVHHALPFSSLVTFGPQIQALFPAGRNPFDPEVGRLKVVLFNDAAAAQSWAELAAYENDANKLFLDSPHLIGDNHPGLRSFINSELQSVFGPSASAYSDGYKKAKLVSLEKFAIDACPSSEFSGMLRLYRNGGSGSVSV